MDGCSRPPATASPRFTLPSSGARHEGLHLGRDRRGQCRRQRASVPAASRRCRHSGLGRPGRPINPPSSWRRAFPAITLSLGSQPPPRTTSISMSSRLTVPRCESCLTTPLAGLLDPGVVTGRLDVRDAEEGVSVGVGAARVQRRGHVVSGAGGRRVRQSTRRSSPVSSSGRAWRLGPPVWSRDSTRIAFTAFSAIGDPVRVFVVDADGTNLVDLGEGSLIQWSPDGEWLLVSRPADDEGFIDLWIMRADGSDARSLGTFLGSFLAPAAW